jgi:hypothetical protein
LAAINAGIHSDPNRPDDRQYIVRLVGQVIRVSLKTVRIVDSLPPALRALITAAADQPRNGDRLWPTARTVGARRA